ncbi:MAG: nicotinate phosphoribosyltransferase [Pseudomonadota bacterium]
MSITAPTMQKDVYKEFHGRAYHPDVSEVYANFTSRSGRLSNVPNNDKVVFVGLQYFIKSYLMDEWDTFFKAPKTEAVANHQRIMSAMLGYKVDVSYLERLHDLGYLPLKIKSLEEGTLVPYQVPPITVVNTKEGFQWLTNMIETVLSCENWPIQTSATTSVAYMKTFKEFAQLTGLPMDFVPFQGHDFSFRGMFGKQAAAMSGFGHLASGLVGTDTITAVLFAEQYYGANVDNELVGCSVDATEHSVTCSWIMEGEIEFFQYLMKEQSPTGILSVVSDTWDFWTLVTEYLPQLKEEVMARDGTLVIRPDSGDPVKILTGYTTEEVTEKAGTFIDNETGDELMPCEVKGLIECLWDTFGGTMTDKGFKLLDDHIGAIYGDAITLGRQREILQRLADKGFASKVVLGIGSYSYQYVTRDTHGSAVKATSVVKNNERIAIFKDPKTDTKKKSAKGLLKVIRDDNDELILIDDVSEAEEQQGLLKTVFENGKLVRETTLSDIRALIDQQI